MNKIVKEMFELSKTDKKRKSQKITWDMYYLYTGWAYPKVYGSYYKKKEKVTQNEHDHFEII